MQSPEQAVFQKIKEDFYIDNMRLDHGTSMPYFHYHDAYELFCLKEGRKIYVIDDEDLDMSGGDLLIIRPGEKHRSVSPDSKPQYRLIMHFRESSFSRFGDVIGKVLAPEKLPRLLRIPTDKLVTMENLFERISTFDAGDISDPVRHAEIECLMFDLVCRIRDIAARDSRKKTAGSRAVESAKRIIDSNHSTDISLGSVAETVYVSPNHLSALFHRYTGMTFSQYLSDARIRHAVRLLKSTELSVSEISAKCGFTNPNYMGDVFRSAVGVSPTVYRKLSRSGDDIKFRKPDKFPPDFQGYNKE